MDQTSHQLISDERLNVKPSTVGYNPDNDNVKKNTITTEDDMKTYLMSERDVVESLKKELDKVIAGIRRETDAKQSDATNSSLGIFNLDDVDDFKHDDTNELLERLNPLKDEKDECELSWRMTKELARQSISSRNSSLLSGKNVARTSTITNTTTTIPKWTPLDYMKTSHVINPFDGDRCSILSVSNEEFFSGDEAAVRIMQEEANWLKEKGDIPVEHVDRSLSGIYPGDDRLSSASSYLRKGSHPIGSLDGKVDINSRPNFGRTVFSPVKSREPEESVTITSNEYNPLLKHFGNIGNLNDNSLDEVPTKECPSNWTKTDVQKKLVIGGSTANHDKQQRTCVMNASAIGDDRLSVSSVASITHIAELLGDMSVNTSPRLIIDKMLSAGSSRDKTNGDLKKLSKPNPKLKCIQEVSNNFHHREDAAKKEISTKTSLLNVDDSLQIISSCEAGKENLNESVWAIPSRRSSVSDNVVNILDHSNVFKIPESKKLTSKKCNDTSKSNIVLSDATNTFRDFVTTGKNKTTKKVTPLLINVDTNKTIYEDTDKKKIRSSILTTESGNRTRYSSSNLSSIGDHFINSLNSESEIDIYDFDIMRINKLPSYSSIEEELNLNCKKKDGDVKRNNSIVGFNDDSVICLSDSDVTCSVDNILTTSINISDGSSNVQPVSVCVGMIFRCTVPCENVLSIGNNCSTVIKCKLSVKWIKCDNMTISIDNASVDVVRFYYQEEFYLKQSDLGKNIEVYVVPLVAKCIDVCLLLNISPEEEKNIPADTKAEKEIDCLLKVIGEHPKVTIQPQSLTETALEGINFGLLPEESFEKSFIKLQNDGNVRVPILMEISKLSSDMLIFYLTDSDGDCNTTKENKDVLKKLIMLDPGQIINEPIHCFTPPLIADGGHKIVQVSGILSFNIATTERDVRLPTLAELQLLALVGKTRVMIASHCNPLTIPDLDTKQLVVRNSGVTPVKLKLCCDNPLFTIIGDSCISLEPEQNGAVDVRFMSDKGVAGDNSAHGGDSWKGTLLLSIVSSEICYTVELQGTQRKVLPEPHGKLKPLSPRRLNSAASSSSSSGSNATPSTSRSSSPCISSSSYPGSHSGKHYPLDLSCTRGTLVWASRPLLQNNSASRKSCVLRNKTNHREKLMLTISDPMSSFKLVEEKGMLVTQMRLNLEAMESRQLTVSFIATQVGPCKGTLIIKRSERQLNADLPIPSEKKVLHLYGYGGKSVLNIKGVFRDPELKMWTYLDSNTLTAMFTLENTGDGTAFAKLSQEIGTAGVIVRPEECLIAAHKSVDVELTFSPTTGCADHLLSQSRNGDVLNVSRIILTHGDEATRLRLKRLYNKITNEKRPADRLLMERLASLNNLFPGSNVNEVSVLKDDLEGMKTLWLEGIRENTIGVLLEKSTLENAQLDSTARFVDLGNTIMDETLPTTRLQQLIVAPRVVTLSPSQPISSFSLRNTTVLQSRFHIEIPPWQSTPFALVVKPQRGTLPPHTSCLLTVERSSNDAGAESVTDKSILMSAPSCVIIKIHSDLMNIIEVPVNWNTMC